MNYTNKKKQWWVILLIPLLLLVSQWIPTDSTNPLEDYTTPYIHHLVPKYEEGDTYVVVNNNIPLFEREQLEDLNPGEWYSELDDLMRVGTAEAVLTVDMMPDKERGDISKVKPTGWHQEKVEGDWLYHRSHLVGHQLTGQDDNPQNLMTGTRFFNTEGMLPIENFVAHYIETTPDAIVRYRITPLFEGYNLLASGVFMEAISLQGGGEDIAFHVFVPNYQPGVELDYQTGKRVREPLFEMNWNIFDFFE